MNRELLEIMEKVQHLGTEPLFTNRPKDLPSESTLMRKSKKALIDLLEERDIEWEQHVGDLEGLADDAWKLTARLPATI